MHRLSRVRVVQFYQIKHSTTIPFVSQLDTINIIITSSIRSGIDDDSVVFFVDTSYCFVCKVKKEKNCICYTLCLFFCTSVQKKTCYDKNIEDGFHAFLTLYILCTSFYPHSHVCVCKFLEKGAGIRLKIYVYEY